MPRIQSQTCEIAGIVSSMSQLDREIDHLYELPLSEFTKARDELAKRASSDREAIRRLQKPNVAAWAARPIRG